MELHYATHYFSLVSGGGNLYNITGGSSNFAQPWTTNYYAIFNAPSTPGTSVVRITDSTGNTVDSTITVTGTAQGALDTTYNSAGTQPGTQQTIAFSTGDEFAQAAVLDASNNIYIAGYSLDTATGLYRFAITKVLSTGLLDATFGTAGKIRLASIGGGDDYATSIAIQADGKIVVGGYCDFSGNAYDFCVARLTTAGVLDTAGFNAAGTGVGGNGIPGTFMFPMVAGNYNDFSSSIAIQADQKIVMAGSCASATAANYTDICVARVTTAGALDAGFGGAGKIIEALAGPDTASSIAIQADQKILIGGSYQNYYFTISRYTTAGVLDTGFGSNGSTGGRVYLSAAAAGNANSALSSSLNIKMLLQPDSKILIGGSTNVLTSLADYNYFTARVTGDGSIDDTYGSEGRFVVTQSVYGAGTAASQLSDYVGAIALQNDGKLIAAGRTFWQDLTFKMSMLRVTPDGSLDSTFGSNGRSYQQLTSLNGNAYSKAIVVQSDGKLVVIGHAHNGTAYRFFTARFWP